MLRKNGWMEQEARARGYEPVTCDCGGSGVLVRPSVNSPTGTVATDPCPGCGGSGRWWAPAGRHYLAIRLHDDQLLDLIREASTR
jgi:hypothetical protein